MDNLRNLDEEKQRRLILQAAKACGRSVFNDLRNKQPTLDELNKEISESFWTLLILGFIFVLPWIGLFAVFPKWRVRSMVYREWASLLANSDEECAHLVMFGDIRRILQKLPRSQKRQKREIYRELKRMMGHWSDLQAKRERLESTLRAFPESGLEEKQKALTLRIAAETDPIVLASLQNQLQAIEGQQEAQRSLLIWRTRLETAQEECTQGVLHLRSQLTLLATTGSAQETAAFSEASASLQRINSNLSATQNAAEEVLQLRA